MRGKHLWSRVKRGEMPIWQASARYLPWSKPATEHESSLATDTALTELALFRTFCPSDTGLPPSPLRLHPTASEARGGKLALFR